MNKLRFSVYRFFSYIISFALSLCIVMGVLGTISVFTLASENYMVDFFQKNQSIQMLSDELDKEYEELSKKSKIPKEVFSEAVGYNFIRSVQRSVAEGAQTFASDDFTGSTDLETRIENAVDKYDSENDIKRSDKAKKKICAQAADLFNKTCAVTNNAQLRPIYSLVNGKSFFIAITSFAGAVLCIALIVFLNGRRHKSFNFVAMSFVISGEVMTAVPVVLLIKNVLSNLCITNIEAYNIAISSAVKSVLMIIIAAGIVMMIIGVVMFAMVYKYYYTKLIDSDTEQSIADNLI
ncbi:MAG: hypothetical protein NC213_05680 [Acetobacter sp.]|nr:hypothetical protein [Bacteroides sp.]MCM1341218.1 hypothetical protein [Acetobacter sp.]MCM1433861.1 hypothetical protein [Clostridiales bacterium]